MLDIQKRLTNTFYVILSLPATAMGFALSVQISALSWILSTQYHLEIEDIGLVWAAGPIAGILGQVIIGAISDNVWFLNGRRRPFILIGGVLAALMLLALPNIDVITGALGLEALSRGASFALFVEQSAEGRGLLRSNIEALGLQQTFASCLEVLKPGGTLSSLGVYSSDLTIPLAAFHAGLGDNKIVTSLCPGGKERMRRLMNVIAAERLDLGPLVTHHYGLDRIEEAYELFANQRDGVLKVAITT